MTDPLQFPTATPRHALPLLFAGQAQKEFFVNAALSLCDMLLHPAIEGAVLAPPAGAEDGKSWLVAPDASGDFAGRDGQIASRQTGIWLFASPRDGMRVFDRSTGQLVLYAGGWRREYAIAEPSGGAVVDIEARAAIGQLIAALSRAGTLPEI